MRASTRGSALIIVLVTLLFTAMALVAFLDRASNDLLVEAHAKVANRLRIDAYSALEVTMAVLEDFRTAGGGLHSPSEGWTDPLHWAGWAPADGTTVEVAFEDESSKIPLIHTDSNALISLFEYWQLSQADAERLADGLLSWMMRDYISSTGASPDYERGAIPYAVPQRPLRSYAELAAIDPANKMLYDDAGRPNELWWRFVKDFSLFNFKQPNVNGANADLLGGVAQLTADQRAAIDGYINGTGASPLGKHWFNAAGDLAGVVGSQGNTSAFGTTIEALRILVTVHQGSSSLRLSVVAAPAGGASTVQTTATDVRKGTSTGATGETTVANGLNTTPTQSNTTATPGQAAVASTAPANLRYPFTILEILENDEILTPPPPPPSI